MHARRQLPETILSYILMMLKTLFPLVPATAEPIFSAIHPMIIRADCPSISCVIPCLNESHNLPVLLTKLVQVLSTIGSAWEIIVVNDGSTDDTTQVLAPWLGVGRVRELDLSRNFGKEAAMTAGLEHAKGDVVVILDADLQHSPDMIFDFLTHWRAGADVVYAQRMNRDDERPTKRWATGVFYSLINMASRFEVPAGAGDFRLMDRKVVDALLALPERNRFMKGLYAWVGFNNVAIPYEPLARGTGKTTFGPLALLRMSFDGLTSFTMWPLKAVSTIGFIIALLGFFYGAAITVDHLVYGNPVSGWTTIVVCLLLFCGIQLISIGVIGEYVGRVFEEVKQRPVYVVKRDTGAGLQQKNIYDIAC
jgi:polyisoprenyl-phosphate glycosyltransferase